MPRSLLTICLISALVMSVAVGCSNGSSDTEIATQLIEEWAAGWNDNDRDTLVEAFSDEGTYSGEGYHVFTWVGRDEIRRGARVNLISEITFTSPVAASSDGDFVCAVEFLAAGYPFVAEIEFEVGDGLITRMHQVDEQVDG
ncbi:MAG: nuclear transport factor 2 family protein [Acidimicrobiia bacterium]|nr:nuclear transport factor 2 family protein [Acidimicrobiia bacterium]